LTKNRHRIVFDSNVIVSALLFEQSVPGRAFYAALKHGEVLLSQETVVELKAVLSRKKFDRYLTMEERQQFLVRLLREATLVEVTEQIEACRDPKDNKFLELAVSGGANCVVTGDPDLLALDPFRGIPLLTPAQFVKWFNKGEEIPPTGEAPLGE
jgi:putative PIN family toxin of toxin-antitoxin system